MKKYLAEFIGSLILCLVFIAVLRQESVFVAIISLAMALLVISYAFRKYTIGMFNPAVTLLLSMCKEIPTERMPRFIVVQTLGAIVAGLLAILLWSHQDGSSVFWSTKAFAGEFAAGYFFFLLIGLLLINHQKTKSIDRLLIGPSYGVVYSVFHSITIAACNPAIILSLSIFGVINWADVWLYIIANLAAVLFSHQTILLFETNRGLSVKNSVIPTDSTRSSVTEH